MHQYKSKQANIKYLKKPQYPSNALNTTDLKAKLDTLGKIHFIGHNSSAKSHLVRPIGLNKPKYGGKEFQKVKVVLCALWCWIPPIPLQTYPKHAYLSPYPIKSVL